MENNPNEGNYFQLNLNFRERKPSLLESTYLYFRLYKLLVELACQVSSL